MQALILAGGLGTRLRAVLPNLPKPMAPIRDKPFLAYLLDFLAGQGIREVVFAVHYKRESIQNYFRESYHSIKIKYVVEEVALGTGGAIKHALSKIKTHQPLFILNGDTFVKLDYPEMYHLHQQTNNMLTIALRKVNDCGRYGSVGLDNNYIVNFREKGDQKSGLINAGVYLVQPDLFQCYSLPEVFSFENEFLIPFLAKLKPQAFITDDYFIDIGIPEDYLRAQQTLIELN